MEIATLKAQRRSSGIGAHRHHRRRRRRHRHPRRVRRWRPHRAEDETPQTETALAAAGCSGRAAGAVAVAGAAAAAAVGAASCPVVRACEPAAACPYSTSISPLLSGLLWARCWASALSATAGGAPRSRWRRPPRSRGRSPT